MFTCSDLSSLKECVYLYIYVYWNNSSIECKHLASITDVQEMASHIHLHFSCHANKRIDLLSDVLTSLQTALLKSLKGFFRASEGRRKVFTVTSLRVK